MRALLVDLLRDDARAFIAMFCPFVLAAVVAPINVDCVAVTTVRYTTKASESVQCLIFPSVEILYCKLTSLARSRLLRCFYWLPAVTDPKWPLSPCSSPRRRRRRPQKLRHCR